MRDGRPLSVARVREDHVRKDHVRKDRGVVLRSPSACPRYQSFGWTERAETSIQQTLSAFPWIVDEDRRGRC